MKTTINTILKALVLAIITVMLVPNNSFAQETKSQALDQNISIYAEDEELEEIDELDEEELAALEEFRKSRELAEHFDDSLGEREKK